MRVRTGCAILLGVLLAMPGAAQIILDFEEQLDFDRPESWAMKYFTAVNMLTGLGPPRALEPGAIEVAVEGGWIPSLSVEERTVGFNGIKEEEINRSSVFGRPRVTVGLPGQFSLEASYVPEVELFGVEPHLFAVALARPLRDGRRWRLGGRLIGQYATLTGDFTCSAEDAAAGVDPILNPFRCEQESNDEMTIRTASFELSAARSPRTGGAIEPYLTAGATMADLEFQVRALYGGLDDRTRQLTDGWIYWATAGLNVTLGRRISVVGEVFYAPLDVTGRAGRGEESGDLLNARAALRYTVR